MIELKECGLNDLNTLKEISIETFSDTFAKDNTEKNMHEYLNAAYNTEQLRKELQQNNSYFYFVYFDNELAGYLKLNIDDGQSEDMGQQTLEVERIYIQKNYKRHGLGKYLINYAIDMSKKYHKKRIWLGVWEHNEPAKIFYQRMGFKKVSEHNFQLGDSPQTDFILIKDL